MQNVRKTVLLSVLSGVAFLLMSLDFPIPGLPAFLKIDFSDVPALLAGIIFSPLAAVAVEALKNVLHYITHGSAAGIPIDQLANFLAGTLFVVPMTMIIKKSTSVKTAIVGGVVATTTMALVMSVANYFVIFPAYTTFAGFPAMESSALLKMIATGILPFNLIKGAIVSIVFIAVYQRLSSVVRKLVIS